MLNELYIYINESNLFKEIHNYTLNSILTTSSYTNFLSNVFKTIESILRLEENANVLK